MILMEHTLPASWLHYASFGLGALGLLMVVVGVFARGDTRQTLWGLFGGLLFWTGWVEFLFMYYAGRYGTQPEIENGLVVTKPEYLILPATFGFWMMFMLLYLFSIRSGCNFFNWCQKRLFGAKRSSIVARPMTRHTSIVTFMELNMLLWSSYLLLMFCYDKQFLGDHHPLTFAVGLFCLFGSFFIFGKQLRLGTWGANLRMAIATVIVFWTPVEIMGRINLLREIWVEPLQFKMEMSLLLAGFLLLGLYIYLRSRHEAKPLAKAS
jgi:hypothetical protein